MTGRRPTIRRDKRLITMRLEWVSCRGQRDRCGAELCVSRLGQTGLSWAGLAGNVGKSWSVGKWERQSVPREVLEVRWEEGGWDGADSEETS